MKIIFLTITLTLGLLNAAHAALSRSAVTQMVAQVYGFYTTSDPTCQTGLVATVPLSATPQTFNMTEIPKMGIGPVANPLNCVVMVLKNQVSMAWAAGTYTSSTNGSSDSVCNPGGSVNQKVCGSGSTTSVTWPAQISADLAALGLSAISSCTSPPTGNEVVPVYISTDSACTGNATFDATTAGCTVSGYPANNAFSFPTTASNTSKGIKLVPPGNGSGYKFIIDPDLSVGAQSGACANISPPRFGFMLATGT